MVVARRPGETGREPGGAEATGQLSLESRFAPPAPVPGPRIYGVGELVRSARQALEARFADVRVEGEISGLRRSGPGHLYFCLKDEEAQLDTVMFAREAGRLKFRVEEGMAVRCRGRLTIYEGRGKFQLCVSEMEPTGAGALALAFEQLKRKLAAEGLFDPARKRRIPFLPRRIGVVTSVQGAVIRDIVRVAHRRAAVPILVADTPVQGDEAAPRIAAAIRRLAALGEVDVVIVARGGGSLEDLWAFNEEIVARAIAACPVPVISAVGHETDFTISDFVADLRAPTPSAAAELAVPVAAELRAELALLERRAARATHAHAHAGRLALERLRARVADPRRLIDGRRQALDDHLERGLQQLRSRLANDRARLRQAELALYRAHPQRRVAAQRADLTSLAQRLAAAITRTTVARGRALEGAMSKLEALSPLKVLERGYSITQRADGTLVTRSAQVGPGDNIRIRLREGEIDATVEKPPER